MLALLLDSAVTRARFRNALNLAVVFVASAVCSLAQITQSGLKPLPNAAQFELVISTVTPLNFAITTLCESAQAACRVAPPGSSRGTRANDAHGQLLPGIEK